MRILSWSQAYRLLPLVLLDIAAVYGSYAGALLLRFDGNVDSDSWRTFIEVTPAVALGYVAANFVFGVYHAAWKYGGIRDLFSLATAVAFVTLVVFLVNLSGLAFTRRHLPVSVNLIGGGLIFLTMASTKLWAHLNVVQFALVSRSKAKRVLIVGAGDVGQLVAREFLHNPHWDYRAVCFVDDDPRMTGLRIHGIPVAGGRHQIPDLVAKYKVDMVTLTMQSIPRRSFRELLEICRSADVPLNIVPSTVDVLSGRVDRAVTVRFRS